jgi:hypothetical protein
MLKALTSLLIAGAAALAIASPAAAAPDCHDDHIDLDPIYFTGSYQSYDFDTSQFCDSSYTITSIEWVLGSYYVNFSGSYGFVDGIYSGPETAVVTVTDGVDTDTFSIEIEPHFTN